MQGLIFSLKSDSKYDHLHHIKSKNLEAFLILPKTVMTHKGSDEDLRLSYGFKFWTASYLRCFVFFKLTLNSFYSVEFPLSCSRRPLLSKEGCVKCAEMFRWVAVVGV